MVRLRLYEISGLDIRLILYFDYATDVYSDLCMNDHRTCNRCLVGFLEAKKTRVLGEVSRAKTIRSET
ncbi:MAG: hypothetical protein B0D91_02720 [Oceanospirillales bacterium LUC14_002_19_P2]|nr:MAG: hypothetical protein B0D91_02720 [Oceanospirillales bacterium LUC14_002_19_P2]